eukprot:SAG31_NODE_13804_length_846_cov_0.677376_2_plen_55_part_00
MGGAEKQMKDVFKAEYVSLHVRKSNKAAFHLYTATLKYGCAGGACLGKTRQRGL